MQNVEHCKTVFIVKNSQKNAEKHFLKFCLN